MAVHLLHNKFIFIALQFWKQLYKERQEEVSIHLEKQSIGEEKTSEDTVSNLVKEDSSTADKTENNSIVDEV